MRSLLSMLSGTVMEGLNRDTQLTVPAQHTTEQNALQQVLPGTFLHILADFTHYIESATPFDKR